MSDSASTAVPPAEPARRRRWPRRLAIVLLLLVGLLVAAPYLMRIGPLRAGVLKLVASGMNGSIHVGRAPLGWGAPLRLYDVEIRPATGPPILSIPAIEGDRPLWRLVFERQALGTIAVTKPLTQVVIAPDGPNFSRLFPPREPDAEEAQRQREQLAKSRLTLAVQIVDGRLSWQGAADRQPWEVGPLNVTAGLERPLDDPDGAPELVIQPGKLLDHVALKPEMCRDLLQFIAPAVAGVTRAEGAFSLEFDKLRLPLDHPEQGDLAGRFSIHHVATSPSPMVQMIKSAVRLTAPAEAAETPPADELWLELANESVVEFEMRDARVYHRDLRFGLGTFQIETSGSVGLDETLDLVARVHLPDLALENRPFLSALGEQTLVLPIGGTLKAPKVDARRMGQSTLQALLGAVDAAANDPTQDPAQLEQELAQSGLVGDGSLFGEGGLVDEEGNLDQESLGQLIEGGAAAATEMLEWWRKRREERDEQQEGEGGAPASGLFGRLRRPRGSAPVEAEPSPAPDGAAEAEPPPATPAGGGLLEGIRRRRANRLAPQGEATTPETVEPVPDES